ncbi:transposase [Candidatus Acetothermia bacterium]|nr:transposase [Candidatus Acetothermia bacterium]
MMSIKPRRVSATLESLVPSDHELRRIDQLLDFSSIRDQVHSLYSATGRPSIDPAVILRLFFLLFFYGIRSERRLLQEVRYNLAYRWFVGYDLHEPLPHHCVLTKARARWGLPIFRQLFERIVRRCLRQGLVEGHTTFLDATVLRANASRDSLREPLVRPARVRLNELLYSKTDPEAGLVSRDGQRAFFGYKVHRALDARARIITETLVTSGDLVEQKYLTALVEGQRHRGIDPIEVVADANYGTIENYRYLLDQGKVVHIKRRQSGRRLDRFVLEDFRYDAQRDRLICPQGKVLRMVGATAHGKRYRARGTDCRACPVKARCTDATILGRTVQRPWEQAAIEVVKEHLETERAAEHLKKRQVICEGSFAEAKNFHHFGRALYRGKWKMQVQDYLIAVVQNVKRLLRWELQAGVKLSLGAA